MLGENLAAVCVDQGRCEQLEFCVCLRMDEYMGATNSIDAEHALP